MSDQTINEQITLTDKGQERVEQLLFLLDSDYRVTDTFSKADVIDLAVTLLLVAAKCDAEQSSQDVLRMAVAVFRVENGKLP